MSDRQTVVFDMIATIVGAIAAGLSTLDHIEQWCRIFLLLVSIVSGALLILVNWKKGIAQIREFLKGNFK
jgi:uncharacterized membrane protein YeaQ/YmgE (transglycosylase-associated protein family)